MTLINSHGYLKGRTVFFQTLSHVLFHNELFSVLLNIGGNSTYFNSTRDIGGIKRTFFPAINAPPPPPPPEDRKKVILFLPANGSLQLIK